jgi:hypothetical protein
MDRWSRTAWVLAALGLGGCCTAPDSPDPAVADDPAMSSVSHLRKPDPEIKFDGLSDRARAIERDMGATD